MSDTSHSTDASGYDDESFVSDSVSQSEPSVVFMPVAPLPWPPQAAGADESAATESTTQSTSDEHVDDPRRTLRQSSIFATAPPLQSTARIPRLPAQPRLQSHSDVESVATAAALGLLRPRMIGPTAVVRPPQSTSAALRASSAHLPPPAVHPADAAASMRRSAAVSALEAVASELRSSTVSDAVLREALLASVQVQATAAGQGSAGASGSSGRAAGETAAAAPVSTHGADAAEWRVRWQAGTGSGDVAPAAAAPTPPAAGAAGRLVLVPDAAAVAQASASPGQRVVLRATGDDALAGTGAAVAVQSTTASGAAATVPVSSAVARQLYAAHVLAREPDALLQRGAATTGASAAGATMRASASSSSLLDAAPPPPAPTLPFESLGTEFDRIYTGIVLEMPGLVAAAALAGKHVPVPPAPPLLLAPATDVLAGGSSSSSSDGAPAGALRLLAATPGGGPAATDRDAALLHGALLRQAGRRMEREAAPALAVGHALLAALSDVLTDASVVALVREAVTARLFPDRAVPAGAVAAATAGGDTGDAAPAPAAHAPA